MRIFFIACLAAFLLLGCSKTEDKYELLYPVTISLDTTAFNCEVQTDGSPFYLYLSPAQARAQVIEMLRDHLALPGSKITLVDTGADYTLKPLALNAVETNSIERRAEKCKHWLTALVFGVDTFSFYLADVKQDITFRIIDNNANYQEDREAHWTWTDYLSDSPPEGTTDTTCTCYEYHAVRYDSGDETMLSEIESRMYWEMREYIRNRQQ